MLLKRVLIPLWIVQLSLLISIIVVTCFIVAAISTKSHLRGLLVRYALSWSRRSLCLDGLIPRSGWIALECFCAICIVLDVVEIIFFAQDQLRPLNYLYSQYVKTAIWIVVASISMVTLFQTLVHWSEEPVFWISTCVLGIVLYVLRTFMLVITYSLPVILICFAVM